MEMNSSQTTALDQPANVTGHRSPVTGYAGTNPRLLARIGGVLYLIIIAIGVSEELLIRNRVVVSGDAMATAANLRSLEFLWRLGIAGELVLLSCGVLLTVIFYVLLRPVSRDLAFLVVLLNVVSVSVEAAAAVSLIETLFPLGNASYLTAFQPEQLAAMARMSIRSHSLGFSVALIFFGIECIVLGYLIVRSTFLPKTIGVLMALAGVAYLINSFAHVLAPALGVKLFPIFIVPFVAEASFAIWLLIKGVNEPRWSDRAAALRSSS